MSTNKLQLVYRYGGTSGASVIINSADGIRIPQCFCQMYFPDGEPGGDPIRLTRELQAWHMIPKHTSEPDNAGDCIAGWRQARWAISTCLAGPESEGYWDAWEWILNNAQWKDEDGCVWTLHHDDDLWAVCPEIMSNEDYRNFFDEDKPDHMCDGDVYWVCQDCFDYSDGVHVSVPLDAGTASVVASVERLAKQYTRLFEDGARLAFSWSICDCCGSYLGGPKYRLIGVGAPRKSEEE